jgi:hypothetical protein
MEEKSMSNPTDQQIIERLAMFLGWKPDTELFLSKEGTRIRRLRSGFNFCESRDALQPVLEKLSEDHWRKLIQRLDSRRRNSLDYISAYKFLLMISPLTLAAALYEVIGEV